MLQIWLLALIIHQESQTHHEEDVDLKLIQKFWEISREVASVYRRLHSKQNFYLKIQ